MATFTEAAAQNRDNIRKALEFAVFVKPHEDDDELIEQVWDGTGLVVPTGYTPGGLITKSDGGAWSRDQSTSDVTSHGHGEPTRRDITSDITGLAITLQESNRQALELFHGSDLSNVPTDENGNLFFDKASRPSSRTYRVLALAKDGDGSEAIYFARWLPNAQVTGMGEQSWSEETEINYAITFTAYTDDAAGTSMREIWGGPGLNHEALNFQAPAGG